VCRKQVLLTTVALSITVITVLVLHALGITNTGARLEFQTVDIGFWSGHVNHAYYVVQDSADWIRIWNQHQQIFIPQHPPPEIDFSKATVIAVFMGECRTTGYGIGVQEIIDTGLTVVVKVVKVYPGKNCIVGEALTHPYHIVKTSKIDKHVIFQTSETATNCG